MPTSMDVWVQRISALVTTSSIDDTFTVRSRGRKGDTRSRKLRLIVAAETGESHEVELVAACSDRDPGPITLDYWTPRGERIVQAELEEHARKRRANGVDD